MRYNTFQYGDGTKYGASPTISHLLWSFIVDWDGDGFFSGENEATRAVDFSLRRGRAQMLGRDGFEEFGIGEATFILDNADGRYSPLNTSSPLYPYVQPGKFCQIKVKDGNTGTNYDVMYGIIDNIIPITLGGIPHVRISIVDGLRWLQNRMVLIGYFEGSSLTSIVEFIMREVDWPWAVTTGGAKMADTLDYWWVWKSPALNEIRELAQSEAAVFFHGRDGSFYFYNRDFLHNRTKAIDQSVCLRDVALSQPWENIRNIINVSFFQKREFDVDTDPPPPENTLWEIVGSGGFIFIDAGETVEIDATFDYENRRMWGFNEHVTYLVYKLDTVTDITSSCPLTWLQPVSGGTRISVTNNSGFNGYISSLEMNGDVGYVPYPGERAVQGDTSITTYGPRDLRLGGFWMEDPDRAEAMASQYLGFLKDPLISAIIQFEDRPDYQFYLDLYDRAELTLDEYDINKNFRVGQIEHQWLNPNGTAVRTIFTLEPWITPLGGPS